jgi:hypothetical protein
MRLPLRPPKAVQDGDDFPNHRDREADTVPRMREQKEKDNPDQQGKHRSFVPEDIAPGPPPSDEGCHKTYGTESGRLEGRPCPAARSSVSIRTGSVR